ncbi:hypothetical protein Zmor_024001 [Zophobas morio]|uniref:Uncharacterized protein n=1 Tax=Zophobas morio TaxID=2755281 RepID=A0AA38I047_9CUCU|nr:hypothetical protein Zmor_024001 [Zophobas morio]
MCDKVPRSLVSRNKEGSGRSKDKRIPENIENIVNVRQTIGLSHGTCRAILRKYLALFLVCARIFSQGCLLSMVFGHIENMYENMSMKIHILELAFTIKKLIVKRETVNTECVVGVSFWIS